MSYCPIFCFFLYIFSKFIKVLFKYFIQGLMKTHKRELWENRLEPNKLIWKDECVFCITDWEEKQYIIKETKYWTIRYNKYPYYWEGKHLMAIPKKHKEYTYQLSKEELKDYKEVEIFMKEYYQWQEYYSIIRQSMWWRSIKHLHYHYLTWDISHRNIEWSDFYKIKWN